jgi:NAD+ diphosphatase
MAMSERDLLKPAFEPAIRAAGEPAADDLWMIFSGSVLVLRKSDDAVPLLRTPDTLGIAGHLEHVLYLGRLDGVGCYAAELGDSSLVPGNLEAVELRTLISRLEEEYFALCCRALHLITWDKTHAFCGRCGAATEPRADERARACPSCGQLLYPRISPAIIVAIVDGARILLARKSVAPTGRHSVLAGYVEPGESFEECLRREVLEEVGITVKDIRYFGSQPWPFPDALMVAFTARYAGGEIRPDGVEIGHAAWYGADELPAIPGPGSISRKLIDWFLSTVGQ